MDLKAIQFPRANSPSFRERANQRDRANIAMNFLFTEDEQKFSLFTLQTAAAKMAVTFFPAISLNSV